MAKLPGDSTCRCIAFSDDGQTLIAGADKLFFWNANNGQQVAEYDTDGHVNSLAVAGDLNAYATATGEVTLRSIAAGDVIQVFESSPSQEIWLEFSSDSKHLICVNSDSEVYLWDLEQAALTKQIDLSIQDVTAVVTHFDSGRIFTGTEEGVLEIWDLESGEFLIEIARTMMPIISLDISADGSRLLSAEEYQGVTTWDVNANVPSPELNVQH